LPLATASGVLGLAAVAATLLTPRILLEDRAVVHLATSRRFGGETSEMLTILVDVDADPTLDDATRGYLVTLGFNLVDLIDGAPLVSPRFDTVVTGLNPSRLLTSRLIDRLGHSVAIVVLVEDGTPTQTRDMFAHKQVRGVIDVNSGTAGVIAQGILASSYGLECVPLGHGFSMSVRLEEPPEEVLADQTQFLKELASRPVGAEHRSCLHATHSGDGSDVLQPDRQHHGCQTVALHDHPPRGRQQECWVLQVLVVCLRAQLARCTISC